MSSSGSGRVPQGERSQAMRQRLLDATVACLVEYGWSGTSTVLVSERAGVSRGAQLHHFPTKNDLVLAAVEHLWETRGAAHRTAFADLPDGPDRIRHVVHLLGEHFSGDLYAAALELWVAARGDAALHAAVVRLEQRIGSTAHRLTVEALGVDESVPGVRELVQATLDLVRGLGLANTLTDDSARRRRVLDRWAVTLDGALRDLNAAPPLTR
ncbi:TetR/AcrR family transcriptional regulator [Actinocorallia sp. API 0066]|uniref:TetR/AcrR family transcriptional regulator n=1 Tax=Actinocorallia sp. API 0066 TaxID=2896846 RepID=UPI001E42C1B9|nr:TetR/AcrR family transcriptional regulator [Actinocorallia sp. API 0066]MCD0449175.1 TetR/AcrR family transcriptional regulator [Actinocorallia sp. API 0066]